MTKLVQDKRPDLINVLEAEPPKELGLIPAWSYSALKTYEACAYRSYIGKVKKIQEDYGPAAARGTDIHTQAEDYVRGNIAELPDTLKKFETQFKAMREGFINATVELEEEIKQGLAAPVQKFCNNAHMERPPSKRTGSESA